MERTEGVERLSRDELRALDARASAELGIPGLVLMENAGRQAAERLLCALRAANFAGRRPPPPWRIGVVCGPGNNGGDGWVLARHVRLAGHAVEVWESAPPATADAATNRTAAERLGIPIHRLAETVALERALASWNECDALVDGLAGTGLRGAPRPELARILEALNAAARPFKLALDLPSGLDCDLGLAAGACFRADLTVAFAAQKQGFAAAESRRWTGAVVVADIGVPTRWASPSRRS
ncbi:MAG: NAD(P)H-hydrate epimerase [Planctomycetota bacterium]|nr:NAD(P)H-hydrate epimerase [Planctomycetota bacterium]